MKTKIAAPAGFKGAYERAARRPASAQVLSDILSLVGYEVKPEVVCCQCGAVDSVVNRHAKSEQARVAITWRCARCNRHVCINCTLTIPGSVPTEFYETTWCSDVCRLEAMTASMRQGV